ncbi:hypothetical protein ES708_31178 [subsurface metagenome]
MSKNLEELKELNEDDYKGLRSQDVVMYYITPILEGFDKRLKAIETELGIYTEGEIKKIKVGGTDPN